MKSTVLSDPVSKAFLFPSVYVHKLVGVVFFFFFQSMAVHEQGKVHEVLKLPCMNTKHTIVIHAILLP